MTTLTVLLIIGIMRVTGKTRENDSDFLLSLKIKKRDIIISKLINKYLFDLFFSFTMMMPYIVLYEIFAPAFSAPVLIFGLITVFVLPLMSVGVSQIMDFVVVKLFNRIKGGNILKSLVPTLIYIALLVLMLIKTGGYGTVQFESMEAYFQDRFFSNQVLAFIFDQSLVSILVFVAITFIPAIVGILLYINVYGKNFGVYSNKKEALELKRKQRPFNHLLKKEIKSYFSTPAYLVNTIIGPILIVAASVAAAAFGIDMILSSIGISVSGVDGAYMFSLVVIFCIAMTTITSASISLEGKTLWFLHSMPIPANQIFMAKLFIPLIVVTPSILISSAIVAIMFKNILSGLIVLGISLLFLLINDVSGLMINLWFPKLNWENEVQVVKQSLSVLLAMVFNSVVAVIPVLLYLIFDLSIAWIALITVIVYAVLLVVFTCMLFTKGKKIFNQLKQ